MSGPWEKYQKSQPAADTSASAASGPWAKYASQSAPAPQENVIQEMPDWLSHKDRLVVKNLMNSDSNAGLKYLQQQYPDAEVQSIGGNDYKLRKKGEKDWRVLDPDTGILSKDTLNDVGDVLWDAGSGVAEGAAATAGGIAGFAGGAGIGAVPGAMAGGAAAGAGLETLRQGLGNLAGLDQGIDKGDVALSGVSGAVSPLLFGVGSAPEKALAKSAVKGMTEDAAKEAWDQSQRGLFKRGYDYLPAKVGQLMSGIHSSDIKLGSKYMTNVEDINRTGSEGFYSNIANKIRNYADKQKDDSAQELISAISGAGKKVDIDPAADAMAKQAKSILSNPRSSPAEVAKAEKIISEFNKQFGFATPIEEEVGKDITGKSIKKQITHRAGEIDPQEAWSLQKSLKKAADYDGDLSQETAAMKTSARAASSEINKGLDKATEGLSTQAKKRYQEAIKFEDEMLPNFEAANGLTTAQRTQNTLNGLDRSTKEQLVNRLRDMAATGKLDLTEDIDVARAYEKFGNRALELSKKQLRERGPLAGAGAVTGYIGGREVGGPVGGGLGALSGASVGGMIGGPKAIKAMIKATLAAEKAAGKVSSHVPAELNRSLKNAVGAKTLESVWQKVKRGDE